MRIRTAVLAFFLVACVGDDPSPVSAPASSDGGTPDGATNPNGTASLSIDPLQVTFPIVGPGDTSQGSQLVVTNNGTAASAPLEQPQIGGANASSFGISTNACAGKVLAPGASCNVLVVFKPVAEGPAAATFTLGSLTVALSGTSSVFTPESTSDGVTNSLRAVYVQDPTHVFAAGDNGRVISSDGATWSARSSPGGSNQLRAIYASSGGDVYVGGAGPTLFFQPPASTGFTTVTFPASSPSAINALWAPPSGTSVYAFGEGGRYLIFNQGTNPSVSQAFPVMTAVLGVGGDYNPSGGGSTAICAAGVNNTVAYYSSSAGAFTSNHQYAPASRSLTGVWAKGANFVAVASDGAILRGTDCDSGLSVEYSGGTPLAGIWGTAANDLWAVGANGTVLHSAAPGSWTKVETGTTKDLRAVHGSGDANIYVVGDGVILHKKK